MPDYTVSSDIDDLLRTANDAAARTELGLGTAATSNTGDFAAASHTHVAGDIDSTGATDGWVLTADGAGGSAFEVAAGGVGGGASQLSDLTDVNTSTPSDKNVLVADGVDFESRALLIDDISNNTAVSTGLLTGGVLSAGAGATEYSITDGTGVIATAAGAVTSVSWTGKTNITPTNIASALLTWVSIDGAGNVVERTDPISASQARSEIFLGVIVHTDLATVQTVNNEQVVSYQTGNTVHDLADAIGFVNVNGNVFYANGANLSLDKSAGVMFKLGGNYDQDTTNPHNRTIAANTLAQFQYRYSDGTSGPLTDTLIDPDNLDDGAGGLTAVTNNRWSVQRIYIFLSGNIKLQRGVADFPTKAAAIEGIASEAYVTEPSIAANGLLRGWLVVKKSATDLTSDTEAQFISAPKFGEGSTGGASTPAGDSSAILLPALKAAAGTINIGEVVRSTGYSGGQILVELADADAAGEMPAMGVARSSFNEVSAGTVIFSGVLAGLDTSSFAVNDSLYVGTTAGVLTNTRPTGATTGVQAIARVLSQDASNGVIQVIGAGRTNDLPNLTADTLWYGNGSAVPTETSITAAGRAILDDANAAAQRVTLDAQEDISGATITSATVATGDKVLIQDVDDSDNLKTVTAQAIADLGGGGGGGLTLVDKTADANITAVEGEMHVVEMNSGTPFTASRNWTLPVAASVATGDQFGLMIKDGDASFEVNVRTGATGDLLNGVDVSLESKQWELFQAGEVLIITCIDGTTGDYIVERDGRIPQNAVLQRTTDQTIPASTQDPIEHDTILINDGNIATAGSSGVSGKVTLRRDCKIELTHYLALSGGFTSSSNTVQSRAQVNGVTQLTVTNPVGSNTSTQTRTGAFVFDCSTDDYCEQFAYQDAPTDKTLESAAAFEYATLSVTEII